MKDSFKSLHIFLSVSVIAILLFSMGVATKAQDTATPTLGATSGGTSTGEDDSDQLPIYINVVGYVKEVTATTININDMLLIIPGGMTLPTGIQVGKVASIRGNLRDDDTITIITIVVGYHLPTPTPVGTDASQVTPAATELATVEPTLGATSEPTIEPGGTVEPVGTPVADCNKPGQKLGLMISAAYNTSYNKIVALHCKGYSYGVIARAYLLLITGEDQGHPTTIAIILRLRGRGHKWGVIIVILNLNPDTTIIILLLNGGKAGFTTDCGDKDHRKTVLYCAMSGRGGGGNDGSGKGHHGEDDD